MKQLESFSKLIKGQIIPTINTYGLRRYYPDESARSAIGREKYNLLLDYKTLLPIKTFHACSYQQWFESHMLYRSQKRLPQKQMDGKRSITMRL